MSLVSLPQELYPKIFYNLEFKDLCQLPFVSQGLKELFSKDEFWKNSFFYKFPDTTLLPNETAKKQFLARVNVISVKDVLYLSKVFTSFFCNLKWNKKRELICTFPNEPTYSLKLSQSFGPVRGAKEGSKENADETEYYKCLKPASNETREIKNFIGEKFTQCPGTYSNNWTYTWEAPLSQNSIPLAITTNVACRTDNFGLGPEISIPLNYVSGKIPDVDVGFGNTLSYSSDINDWKSPFKLFCITDSHSNKPVWVGLIPVYADFKFILIDSKGAVTWEHGENRHLNCRFGHEETWEYDLVNSLRNHPIRFS